jgi:hypothetical protein
MTQGASSNLLKNSHQKTQANQPTPCVVWPEGPLKVELKAFAGTQGKKAKPREAR